MSSSYTIKYSDETRTLVVPEFRGESNGIGYNNQTSLTLVGRNYPNFGPALAENFLHLLENFAAPTSPKDPTSGQVWYDISNSDNQRLNVFDGNTWFPVNGVHKQDFKPSNSKFGDIWVDTKNLQIYIMQGAADPILVGPAIGGSAKTGPYPLVIQDTDGTDQNVILMYINDDVVEILATAAFTPAVTIDGFQNTSIVPGVNLSSKLFNGAAPRINATANAALNLRQTAPTLEDVSANNFVRNDIDQSMNGRLVINNNNGVTIGQSTNALFLLNYNLGSAKLTNSTSDGDFQFIVNNINGSFSAVTVSGKYSSQETSVKSSVEIGKNTQNSKLTVWGDTLLHDRLYIGTAGSGLLRVFGDAQVRSITATNYIVANTATIVNLNIGDPNSVNVTTHVTPAVAGKVDLGSATRQFNKVWADSIGNVNGSTILNGTLQGPAAYLTNKTRFSVVGTGITSSAFDFNGRDSLTATIYMTVTNQFVFGRTDVSLATSQYIQPNDKFAFATTSSSQLKQISKSNLLADLYDGRTYNQSIVGKPKYVLNGALYDPANDWTDIVPPGTIMLWPASADQYPIPPNWHACDGSIQGGSSWDYSRLYKVLGVSYSYQSLTTASSYTLPYLPPVVIGGGDIPVTVYSNIVPVSTTGTNAAFNVEVGNNRYTVTMMDPGVGYIPNMSLIIPGNYVGGNIVTNDITIDILTTGTNACISNFSYSGRPAPLGGIKQAQYIIKL